MDATNNSKGSLITTGDNCPVLLEFSKAALNKCVSIDLPLLRAIQEPVLGSLGSACHQRPCSDSKRLVVAHQHPSDHGLDQDFRSPFWIA